MWKEQLLKPTTSMGSNVPTKPKREETCKERFMKMVEEIKSISNDIRGPYYRDYAWVQHMRINNRKYDKIPISSISMRYLDSDDEEHYCKLMNPRDMGNVLVGPDTYGRMEISTNIHSMWRWHFQITFFPSFRVQRDVKMTVYDNHSIRKIIDIIKSHGLTVFYGSN
jgi:hypothetical protein